MHETFSCLGLHWTSLLCSPRVPSWCGGTYYRSPGGRLQVGTENAPVLDRLHDSGAVYKYTDFLLT